MFLFRVQFSVLIIRLPSIFYRPFIDATQGVLIDFHFCGELEVVGLMASTCQFVY